MSMPIFFVNLQSIMKNLHEVPTPLSHPFDVSTSRQMKDPFTLDSCTTSPPQRGTYHHREITYQKNKSSQKGLTDLSMFQFIPLVVFIHIGGYWSVYFHIRLKQQQQNDILLWPFQKILVYMFQASLQILSLKRFTLPSRKEKQWYSPLEGLRCSSKITKQAWISWHIQKVEKALFVSQFDQFNSFC